MRYTGFLRCLLLLALLQGGVNTIANAQATTLDSLKNVFYSATNDSIKTQAANQIYRYHVEVDKDSSLFYVEQARFRNLEHEQLVYENKIMSYARLYGIVLLVLLTLVFYRINRQKQKAAALVPPAVEYFRAASRPIRGTSRLLVRAR